MKHLLLAAIGLAATAGAFAQTQPVPVDYGPGPQGATLKPAGAQGLPAHSPLSQPGQPHMPNMQAPQAPQPPTNLDPRGFAGLPGTTAQVDPLAGPWAVASDAGTSPQGLPASGVTFQFPPYREKPDPNHDIRVTEDLGPYMICLITYYGDDAPKRAREMVFELRNNPAYKLPAYTFNHGAEERRKDYERARKFYYDRRELYRKNSVPDSVPIRIPRQLHAEEQVGVLIGGYRDSEPAQDALARIRKLPCPDPTKVSLDKKWGGYETPQGGLHDPAQDHINPFTRGFVGRNPAVKVERQNEKLDLALLQRLNRDEPFSLLNCKKPVTLVLKQISTPQEVKSQLKTTTNKLMEKLGLAGFKRNDIDKAAVSAHNLAEMLRQMNIEAYVLHTKFSSIVTIGSFESVEDPALRSMQHLVQTQLRHGPRGLDQINVYPVPIPWAFREAMGQS